MLARLARLALPTARSLLARLLPPLRRDTVAAMNDDDRLLIGIACWALAFWLVLVSGLTGLLAMVWR